MIPYLQNTLRLSGTIVHLGWRSQLICSNRSLSGLVVVSHGGQPGVLDRRSSVKTQLTAIKLVWCLVVSRRLMRVRPAFVQGSVRHARTGRATSREPAVIRGAVALSR